MTIEMLRDSLSDPHTPEYKAKMCHAIPDVPSVDRTKWLLNRCRGKRVLHLGCASGPLHGQLMNVCGELHGSDRNPHPEYTTIIGDFESQSYKVEDGYDIILCAEVMEHLSCPGVLLWHISQAKFGTLVITVPNAMSRIAAKWAARSIENVNIDHVSWYSWRTMATLLERYGFNPRLAAWYGGPPVFAEGLIVEAEHG